MPKKANLETQKEQSARFRKDARKLIADGDLDPEKGSLVLDALMRQPGRIGASFDHAGRASSDKLP